MESGQVDCKGFQRSPKFCLNTDRAVGTGCFKVPDNMSPGHYVGQWYWEFNQNAPYTTCFDFQVVAQGSSEARIGTPGTTGIPDTSELPCTNNVLKFGANLPTRTTIATTSTAAITTTKTTKTKTTPTTLTLTTSSTVFLPR